MAEEKVTSFIGGPYARFVIVAGDDGEDHRFEAGVKYRNEDVPDSVLKAIDEHKLAGFTSGTEGTVEKHLGEAREQLVQAADVDEES